MYLTIEWTSGVASLVNSSFEELVNGCSKIIESKTSDVKEQVDDILEDFGQLLKVHNSQNTQSFNEYDAAFTEHQNNLDIPGLENDSHVYGDEVSSYLSTANNNMGLLLQAHVSPSTDPHYQYLLTTEIGVKVPRLSNGVVPLGTCPSDVIGVTTVTALKSYNFKNISTDKLFVTLDSGRAFGYSVKEEKLYPFTLDTVSELPAVDGTLAISSKLAYSLALQKQQYSSTLTLFSSTPVKAGYLVLKKDSGFISSDILATPGLYLPSPPNLKLSCYLGSSPPSPISNIGSRGSSGTSNLLARSDHTHIVSGHTHPWKDIANVEEKVQNTVLAGVSSYRADTPLLPTHTVEQAVGYLSHQAILRRSDFNSLSTAFGADITLYKDLTTYGDMVDATMNGIYKNDTVLISSPSGVATSSSLSVGELNALNGCTFNIQSNIDDKHSKISALVSYENHVACPPTASWVHFSCYGVTGAYADAWGCNYVCITDIKKCRENEIYRVTRGGYFSGGSTKRGIILQSDSAFQDTFDWYHGSDTILGECNVLINTTQIMFIRSGNVVFIIGY